jgi:polyferredoxin
MRPIGDRPAVRLREAGLPALPTRLVRPRTVLYAVLISVVGVLMLYTLSTRKMIEVAALHDRNPQYVTLSDGSIRNGYTLRLVNRQDVERTFLISVEGLGDARIESAALALDAQGRLQASVGRDQTLELRILVSVPASFNRDVKSRPVTIRALEPASGAAAVVTDHFFLP